MDDRRDVFVATTVAQVEELRDAWQSAGIANIDSDVDYFLAVTREETSVIKPYVVCIRRPGRPDLFGIARLEKFPLQLSLGTRTLARPRLRSIVLTHGGIVGCAGPEDEELILNELERPLHMREAEALVLRQLNTTGTLYGKAKARRGLLLRLHSQPVTHRWTAEKPETIEAFLNNRSAKSRKEVLRRLRSLEREYGNDLQLIRFDSLSQSGDLVRDLETVAAKTYLRRAGRGFHNDAASRTLIMLGLSQGWLRAWLLYLKGTPVAYWTGTIYAGTFSGTTTGYDPDHSHEAVGRYTMFRMLEDLCADESVSRIDLGQGDFEYKQEFNPVRTDETDVVLLAKRPRPVLFGLIRFAVAIVNSNAKRIIRSSTKGRQLERALLRKRIIRSPHPDKRN